MSLVIDGWNILEDEAPPAMSLVTASDPSIICGDALDVLKTLTSNSVQCAVTSPPYYGLRDYGTATWEGGDAECEHKQSGNRNERPLGLFHGGDNRFHDVPFKSVCGHCGASRIDQQIGLEDTLDEYVQNLVSVFCEVRRVLKPDGILWLVLGDTYKDKQLQGVPWRVAFALQNDGWRLRSEIIWANRPACQKA
jgi:DNA modification methylase